jgi:hypothetical protein
LQQDGSATKPFATIGQAISALPAAGGSVLLTPGVYPEEFPSVETPMKVSFVGLTYLGGECDLTLVDITTNSTVSVQNIGKLKAILLLAPGGSVISVNNCTVLNDCGVDSIDAKFSTFNGDIDSVNGVVGLSTSFQDLTSAGASNYFLTECGLVNANTTGQMGLVDCALQGNITVADITLKGCVSPAACTLVASSSAQVNDSDMGGFIGANAFFAPNLTIDTTSFQSFQEPDNVSFTNLTISDIKEPETVVQTFDQEDDFEFIGVADATAIPAAGLVLPTGRGNWNAISSLANGSIVTTLATAQDHAGVLGIRTAAATINAIAGIQKGNMLSASQIIRADQFRFFDAIVRVPDITTARVWFGYSSDTLSVTPTSAMYFVYDSSVSANWLAVTRSSGVEASSDTGVPVVAGTWYKLMIVRPNIASNLDFYINRANKTHVNTRVPATAVNLCFMGKTLTGAGARGFDIDWEKMQGNLVR